MRILLLVLFLLGLLGCSAGSTEPVFAVFVPKEGDAIEVVTDADSVSANTILFNVTSETGIGSAKVALTSGEWPEKILFRLYLSGLEDFKFAYGDTIVAVSVTSGEQMMLESVVQAGQEQPVVPASEFYMPVRVAEDYFEVEAPADFLAEDYDGFEISWIDFYR